MSGYPWKPSELAFSHDSILLATGGGEDITVWSFEGNGPEGQHRGCWSFTRHPSVHLLSHIIKDTWHLGAAKAGL